MRIPAILGVLFASGLAYAASASAQQCQLSCPTGCRQEAAMCLATAALTARSDRADCDSAARDGLVACDSDALDARGSCVGLCGDALKTCSADVKTALKACNADVKTAQDDCKAAVAQSFNDDRGLCGQDAANCVAMCSAGPQ